jgi:hypothetical protein
LKAPKAKSIFKPTMTDPNDLYVKAAASAKIGIWKIDIRANAGYWDTVTKSILEVSEDFQPIKGYAINFFSEGDVRTRFEISIKKAIEEGISFHEKFQITTAKNNIRFVECACQVDGLANFTRIKS